MFFEQKLVEQKLLRQTHWNERVWTTVILTKVVATKSFKQRLLRQKMLEQKLLKWKMLEPKCQPKILNNLSLILFSRLSLCSSSFFDLSSSIFRITSLVRTDSGARAGRTAVGAGTGTIGASNVGKDSGTIWRQRYKISFINYWRCATIS